jgi:hypothetical protein
MLEEYLTLEETALALKVSPSAVRGYVRRALFLEGEHFYRMPNGAYRFRSTRLVAWLAGDRPVPLPEQRGRRGCKVNLSAVS